MATQFHSEIKTIHSNAEEIFRMLSDLSNIEKIKDKLPGDKIKEVEFDTDSFKAKVDPIGQIGFRIIEREPFATIKFQSEASPIELFLWIQLKQVAEKDTKIRLTVQAELNMFMKGLVSKPLQEGINKLADLLTQLNY